MHIYMMKLVIRVRERINTMLVEIKRRMHRRVRLPVLPLVVVLILAIILYLTTRRTSSASLQWDRPNGKLDALTTIYSQPPLQKNEFVNDKVNKERVFRIGHPTVDIDFNKERVFRIGHPIKHVSSIPKIIHLIWTDELVPTVFVEYVKSFRTHNPKWKIYFWTYARGRIFINKHYPDLVNIFDGYAVAVSRADALRYMVMHHYGGAYFDIDTECLRSLDVIADTNECMVSPEPMENAVMIMDRRSLMSSSGLMCTPQHAFFKYVISQLPLYARDKNIMTAAGPVFISIAFNSFITHYINTCEKWNGSIRIGSYKHFEDHISRQITVFLVARCFKYTRLLRNIMKQCIEEGKVVTDIKFTNERGGANNECTSPLPVADENELNACKSWFLREKLDNPNKDAFAHHVHFGTYQHDTLLSREENNIRNIIPDVHMYPCFPDEESTDC